MAIELPEILNIAPKLIPIITKINDFRYFLIEGGRGGGKSQAISRYILYLADQKKLRIVCGRETQKSIAESVYSIFTDLIRKHNLDFEVFSSKIVSRGTGTEINFRGFREQGAFNIQGMEGVDVIWIDEAQAITKQTLDVLIPTIRKEKAKIFFSMNRHVHDDPVYDTFYGRKDCLHININYTDNPFCTEALKNEAEECRIKNIDDFNHIWLGQPLSQSEDCVFSHDELINSKDNIYPMRDGYGLKIMGVDIARYGDDKSACIIIQQCGALHWAIYHIDEWGNRDLNFTTGRILQLITEHKVDHTIIDESGIGSGPLDFLSKGREMSNITGFKNIPLGFDKDKIYANERTRNVYKLKDMIAKGHIWITDTLLIKELESIRYEYDNYQRKRLVSKDVMKNKYNVKSPNRADSLIMAVSLINNVKKRQDDQYQRKMPQYSPEENLWKLAGVR